MMTTGVPNTVRAQASVLTTVPVCGRLTRRTSDGVTSTASLTDGSEARDFRSESGAYAATSNDGGRVGRLLLLTMLIHYTVRNRVALSLGRRRSRCEIRTDTLTFVSAGLRPPTRASPPRETPRGCPAPLAFRSTPWSCRPRGNRGLAGPAAFAAPPAATRSPRWAW